MSANIGSVVLAASDAPGRGPATSAAQGEAEPLLVARASDDAPSGDAAAIAENALGSLSVNGGEPPRASTAEISPEAERELCPATPPNDPDAPRFTLTVGLLFNSRYVGDIAVDVDAGGSGLVDGARLEELLDGLVTSEILSDIQSLRSAREKVPFEDYCQGALQVAFDSGQLELHANIRIDGLERRALSFAQQTVPSPSTFDAPETFGAGLNAVLTQDLSVIGEQSMSARMPFRGNFEGYASLGGFTGATLFYAFDVVEDARSVFRRRELLLQKDFYDDAIRLQVGDVNPNAVSFQGGQSLGGVTISRQYRAIQPFLPVTNRGRGELELERPSIVEVTVNGVLTETLQLDAGRYRLEDFPAATGANDIELRIEDSLGRTQYRTFSFFSLPDLLPEGLLDFAASAGVPRRATDSGFSYDNTVFASGFVSYGLADWVTLGVNGQLHGQRRQLGGETIFGTPLGTFRLEAALSQRDSDFVDVDQQEWGTAFGFTHRLIADVLNSNITLSNSVITESENFTTAVEGPRRNAELRLQSNLAARLPSGVQLNASGGVERYHDELSNNARATLGVSRPFDRFTLGIVGNAIFRDGVDDQYSIAANLNVRLGARHNARTSYASNANLRSIEIGRQRRQLLNDVSGRLLAQQRDGQDQLRGEVNFIHNRFLGRADMNWTRADNGEDTRDDGRLSLRAATFFGFADGKFAFGQPSPEGFIIVEPHRTLRGSRLKVMDSSGARVEAEAGFFGNALVPIRRSYIPQKFSIEVENAPEGYDFGNGQIDVLPNVGGAYTLTIGSDASRTVLGVLKRADGAPVELLVGKVRPSSGDGEEKVFFTNSTGRFVLEKMAPGEYILAMDGGGEARIVVDDETEGVVNVGEVTVD